MRDDTDLLTVLLDDTTAKFKKLTLSLLGHDRSLSGFLHLMKKANEAADMLCASIAMMAPETPSLACRNGCAFCCSNTVVQTQPAFAIKALYLARTENGGQAYAHAVAQLRNESRDCPFLKDSRCSVYPVRFTACRLYHSYDYEECLKRRYRKSPTFAHFGFIAVAKGLEDGLKALGIDCRDVSLSKALELLTAEPGAAEQWLLGSDIFKSCALPFQENGWTASSIAAQSISNGFVISSGENAQNPTSSPRRAGEEA